MTMASRIGTPQLSANHAAPMAPMPANAIWQSQSMPPSPVTSVNDKNTIASAAAAPSWPSQNGLRINPTTHTTAKTKMGKKKLSLANGSSTSTDAASRLPPCGVMARSSAPPPPPPR